jgi:hypothetical protein
MVDMGDDGEISDVVEGRAHGGALAGACCCGKRCTAAGQAPYRWRASGSADAGARELVGFIGGCRGKSINFNQVR